jgi:crotonobetainyl-CoA:carnitine CoA-transferase CaiB-like acyl-CoA transferase
MPQPLTGLRIVTLEEYGVGPFATQLFADLGADVIKIENPERGGDSSRYIPPHQIGSDSLYFESLNRGKRSVVLDLKSAAGQQAFHQLVASADAVLNNLRSTTAASLGLRYFDLKAFNPRIVCCSASGWGSQSPRAGNPAYDYLLQSYVGNMALTGEPGQPPARSAVPWVDTSTGFASAFAMLAGIWSARATGTGCDVEISMVDVGMSQWMYMAAWYLSAGTRQERQTMSRHPSVVPSQLFETSDGYVIVMPQTQAFWRALCVGLGVPELIEDPRFSDMGARQEHKDELVDLLANIFRRKASDDWIAQLAASIPIGKVNSFAEAMDLYSAEYPSQIVTWEHDALGTVRTIGSPIRINGAAMPPRRAPHLGEHTHEVLASLAAGGTTGAEEEQHQLPY